VKIWRTCKGSLNCVEIRRVWVALKWLKMVPYDGPFLKLRQTFSLRRSRKCVSQVITNYLLAKAVI
jgi:hypothetical protein